MTLFSTTPPTLADAQAWLKLPTMTSDGSATLGFCLEVALARVEAECTSSAIADPEVKLAVLIYTGNLFKLTQSSGFETVEVEGQSWTNRAWTTDCARLISRHKKLEFA